MEICEHCRKVIPAKQEVWGWVFTAKATHSSPAEYDERPYHAECAELIESKGYQDYCDEQESLRGLSPEERERI